MSPIREKAKVILRKIKVRSGFGRIPEVCIESKGVKDFHDYHKHKGGPGWPAHFYKYRCWNCGKAFEI